MPSFVIWANKLTPCSCHVYLHYRDIVKKKKKKTQAFCSKYYSEQLSESIAKEGIKYQIASFGLFVIAFYTQQHFDELTANPAMMMTLMIISTNECINFPSTISNLLIFHFFHCFKLKLLTGCSQHLKDFDY